MEQHQKELYVSRIITGFFRCNINNSVYILKQPDRQVRHIAQEIYSESYQDAELEGLYNKEELEFFLYENNVWDDKKEVAILQLPKDIDELKVKLYQSTFKSEEKKLIRKMLKIAKIKFSELSYEKGAYNHLSCEGIASMNKMRYLVGKGLFFEDGGHVWENEDFWKQTDPLLEDATSLFVENRISDSLFREIARTDPWRTIWSCRKSENRLFDVAAVDLTDEQKNIIVWSSMYDSIYEHPECPSDEGIEDDDCLDGWLIIQRRKRDKNKVSQGVDGLIKNEKIRNSKEIYLIAQSQEDAKKINSLNDINARMTKKERLKELNKHGTISEENMPDSMREIANQMNTGGKT